MEDSSSSEKVLFDLTKRRTWCVDSLKMNLLKLKKIATEDLVRMDQKGLVGYYSLNHDILTCALQVWKTSQEMGVLKAMEKDLECVFKELTAPARGGADVVEKGVDPFGLPAKIEKALPQGEAKNENEE